MLRYINGHRHLKQKTALRLAHECQKLEECPRRVQESIADLCRSRKELSSARSRTVARLGALHDWTCRMHDGSPYSTAPSFLVYVISDSLGCLAAISSILLDELRSFNGNVPAQERLGALCRDWDSLAVLRHDEHWVLVFSDGGTC